MISDLWESHFENPENVTVYQLISKFEQIVCADIVSDFPDDYEERIARFRRGALEAQPKIMTINERNRIHFNITNPEDKKLFYYPDAPNGNFQGRWRNTRIKPLRLMNENEQYVIYWRNNHNNDIETTLHIRGV
jgi:hypothetical protein